VSETSGRTAKLSNTTINPDRGEAFGVSFRSGWGERRASGSSGTVRQECLCLDWLLIASRRYLYRVWREFIEHYDGHRPHRALGLAPPEPLRPVQPLASPPAAAIRRDDRLGGLIHEYSIAA
jgi:hypothetical protein